MIQSMTGFGKAEGNVGNKKFNIEIRSVNSKQFDLNVRMPGIYKEKEMILRNKLSKALLRGKIDLAIYFDSNGEDVKYAVNAAVIESYHSQIKAIAEKLGDTSTDLLASVLKMPEVMTQEKKALDESEWNQIEALIDVAVQKFTEFRNQEGGVLKTDFEERIGLIQKYAIAVEPYGEARKTDIREKILAHLNEYQESVDNVLFDGIEFVKHRNNYISGVRKVIVNYNGEYRIVDSLKTIEDLVELNLTLTQSAIKQLNI